MAAYGLSFESTSSIDERKEKKRQARQEALEKAKQQYDKEQRRKELKRQRGEDTWMLPEVNERLQQIEDAGSVKSKKKKEKKSKKKKEKKKKAKKEKKAAETGDGSSDSSQDSEDEWVELQPQTQTKAWQVPSESKPSESDVSPTQNVQRDEWMTFDFLAMKTTSTADRRAEKERQKEEERAKAQAIEQAGLHKLELNPYWKDGGTGLPPEEMTDSAAKKGPVVNDGGLSWLRKSYQRMKEQAEREQRSLSDVVAERYGSMEEFQQRLAEAEEAMYGQKRREGDGTSRGGWRKGEEVYTERWKRKDEDGEDRDRWRKNEKDKESSSESRERYRGGRGGEREGYRGREEERGRDGDRYRENEKDRERNRNRDRDREGERDRDRGRGRDAGREKDGDRCRDGEREKDRTDAAASSSGQSWNQRSLTLGSLQGRFLKPSEDDDSGETPQRLPPPARPSRGFLKPSSDDEDSSRAPAWKKSSSPACESDTSDKPQQENKRDAEKTVTAPQPAAPPRAESEGEEEEEEEEEEEVPLLSEEELNKLGSKLIKAEIMGNTAVIEKLKSQLEAAHKAKEKHAARKKLQEAAKSNQASDGTSEDREILLFRTDESGRAWPVNAPSGPQEPHGGRRKKKPIETHVDGERVRYFQDDDNVGLKEMVRREKMSSAHDQNALYSRMAAKMMGKTDGDNYTLDDMFVSSAAQREGEGREEERMRNRAIGESRRLAASMEKCQHCFSSKELQKHLIVAIGSKVYLSLPAGVSMTEGHCLICPLQHHCSATGMDEDIWSEMQLFRRTLVRMFEAQELDCVFMETHMNPRRRQHMVLECIPLPKELGDMAPIYFKKAIMECDEEWAMNKKVVDLSSKSIRQAVPRSLPYFAVDFGLQGGFAHVIENEQKFPHYFGKEVVGGMLDLEPRRWRKMIKENFDDQRKKVLQFAQWWKPHDCTKTQG
ncbi:CWF19-like protein 2 [Neolamprologus brichardi]|uniref:CWF19-like protein 2 n=1 Tax=Neolamprologus brichardi TaxID=32507 RepID=UPI0003EBFDD0|nr:CWF19-like protein 2 [Neolamprologus brichardi]